MKCSIYIPIWLVEVKWVPSLQESLVPGLGQVGTLVYNIVHSFIISITISVGCIWTTKLNHFVYCSKQDLVRPFDKSIRTVLIPLFQIIQRISYFSNKSINRVWKQSNRLLDSNLLTRSIKFLTCFGIFKLFFDGLSL